MDRLRTPRLLVAGLLALALVAAACGGDDDAGDGGSDDAVAPEEVLGEPNEATGEPVQVGIITEGGSEAIGSQSDLTEQGAEIGARYVNEHLGGIGGRPIELFVCGNQATPAGAQDCANQMVERGVVAVTLPFTGFGASQAPIITGAGIAYVTGSGNSAEELTAPNSFALTGGYPGNLGAFAQHAADQGIEKFVMVTIDVPSATQAAEALGGSVFDNAGVDYEVIAAAPGTPDLTPELQAAVDAGADAIGVTGDVTFCTSFLQAYQTLALDLTRYVIAPCIDPTVIESLGSVLDGSYVATPTSDAGEDAETYAAILDLYAGEEDIDPNPTISAGVAAGVGSVVNLARAMEGLTGEVTAETVLARMQEATDVPLFLGGGVTFTCDGSAIAMLPDVCSSTFQVGQVTADGTIENLEPVDFTELFAS
ncbi:MAG TPA: ABC transporter substrate-binding protein [Acidimicrobiales bacterium]